VTISHSSRSRLTPGSAQHFPGESLFARLARTLCEASCLPRKELFEAWEMARRVRRHLRGGRVVDLAAGHGLLAFALLLLDDTSAEAICVDTRRPQSALPLAAALTHRWPRLEGRVRYLEASLESVELGEGDLVVSAHACGSLTDRVLERAVAARARVAVLPCCHRLGEKGPELLQAWLDPALSLDVERALMLKRAGYRVRALTIPREITPKNRVLLGEPA
jgi:SAM-dependent methyltransferase